jgi:hypothetical protein
MMVKYFAILNIVSCIVGVSLPLINWWSAVFERNSHSPVTYGSIAFMLCIALLVICGILWIAYFAVTYFQGEGFSLPSRPYGLYAMIVFVILTFIFK